ncbi:hypothetical protein FACS1894178_5460 [Bacteroidia bacterium]|nr:hypothetical protein FACS1894178_5460 [Bacteroidia bacterium]
MKKIIIIAITLLVAITNVNAQKWGSFVQFGTGMGLSVYGDNYGLFFQAEYGKTFKKWLDLSATMSYETEMPWNSYNASSELMLIPDEDRLETSIPNGCVTTSGSISFAFNARVDMVKLFLANSRHSFKIGGSVGLEFSYHSYSKKSSDGAELYYFVTTHEINCLPALRASYEFDITKKFTMGAFFHWGHYSPILGLSFRHNF